MTVLTRNETETENCGEKLADIVRPGDVIAIYGELGAGKTAFVRGLARGMGCSCRVSSPTFTIVNEYGGDIPLFHFDMYRLSGSEELFEIGWEDYLDRGGVCAVEWSENVEDAFPPDIIKVEIKKISEYNREITCILPEGR